MTRGRTPAPSLADGLTIRPATADDALCIGVLGTQVFLDTYATEGIRPAIAREVLRGFATARVANAIASPDGVFVLALRDAQHLVGFAQLTLNASHPLVPGDDTAELDRLYVQERFTGQGIGVALLAAAEALAARHGRRTLWLTAWVGNARALAFYPRHGFEDRGSTPFVFEGESHENRLFAKALDPAASLRHGSDSCASS